MNGNDRRETRCRSFIRSLTLLPLASLPVILSSCIYPAGDYYYPYDYDNYPYYRYEPYYPDYGPRQPRFERREEERGEHRGERHERHEGRHGEDD